jgi:hypothetical protein
VISPPILPKPNRFFFLLQLPWDLCAVRRAHGGPALVRQKGDGGKKARL